MPSNKEAARSGHLLLPWENGHYRSKLFSCDFFFSSRRRHTRYWRDWSSDVCSSDLIPRLPPLPVLPWHMGGDLPLTLATFRALFPAAIAIALLGAIESLLSAVVADAMAGTRHDPDSELLALGVGNILCPFFGGIPRTGAIALTATGTRYGSRSPMATVIHAVVVLLAVLLLAPLISFLPMAALAALLVMVAWNMSEAP